MLTSLSPANSTVDAGSEPAAPTAPEVHNDSDTSDQSENQALVQPLESQAQTTAPQTLAETEYSGVIEDTPELIPQPGFPQESPTDFTLDEANSELDEIFSDLAASPESDAVFAAYATPTVEATEGMTNYVDIIIPADPPVDEESESAASLPLEGLNGSEIMVDEESEPATPTPQKVLNESEAEVDLASELIASAPQDVLNVSANTDQADNPAPVQQLEPQVQTTAPESFTEAVCSVEQIFESLPPVDTAATLISQNAELAIGNPLTAARDAASDVHSLVAPTSSQGTLIKPKDRASQAQPEHFSDVRQPKPSSPAPKLSVRVDLDRLSRMDNLLGELAINRNGLSLQNEQLQRSVRELLHRFEHFHHLTGFLRDLSDKMLIAPERHSSRQSLAPETSSKGQTHLTSPASANANFDSLELDNYGALHGLLQELLEEVIQLEESVGDVDLFAGQSNQMLAQQRQRMTQLRNELMWARMLPLSGGVESFS